MGPQASLLIRQAPWPRVEQLTFGSTCCIFILGIIVISVFSVEAFIISLLLYGWWNEMGFGGQYQPDHIVCDMDRVCSNIILCEKCIFNVSWSGLELGLTTLPQRSNHLSKRVNLKLRAFTLFT